MGANGYDRTYHSDPYKRTYSNIPRGYGRTYSNLPRGYERTYSNVPGYERTYSDNGHYPSHDQHDKYPPMKPHDPKYPSPKPSAWKMEKTPKPTAWTPKPTKAEKTPKPTVWKPQKPTKAEKTPKPTWKKTSKPTKEEKTPKPTVWKSDYDKTPKHYSNHEEENEDGELQNFGICMLDLYQQCTRVFQIGPNAGCYCKSGCCEGNRCVAKKRDWFGIYYCPSECVGAPGGQRGTC